jgi:acyl dehydratase
MASPGGGFEPKKRLYGQGFVIEARPSKSRPEQGLIKVRTTTFNQDGKAVQVLVSSLVVPRRTQHAAAGDAQ